MRYVYFASYFYTTELCSSFGFGAGEIVVDDPITTFAQVGEAQKAIAEKAGKDVTIINYQLLRREEANDF